MKSPEPRCWFPWGANIEIEPVPDIAYNLNLYLSIAPSGEMALATDVPHIPSGFTHLLPMFAASYGFLKSNKIEKFLQLNKMYSTQLLHCIASQIPVIPDSQEGVKIPETMGNVR